MIYLRMKERNNVQIEVYFTILSGLSIIILGPAPFLPDSLILLFTGNFLLGLFIAPVCSIGFPLLKEKMQQVFVEDSK